MGSSDRPEVSSQPLDGGYGWVVVFGCFILFTLSFGESFAFGVLFVAFLDAFDATKAEAAWIGSLSLGVGVISNFIALALLRKYEHRTVIMIGTIMYSGGIIISAFTTSIGQIYFTYGGVSSFGIWLFPLSLMGIIKEYFEERLPLAVALAMAGTGAGQCIMSVSSQMLLDQYGWRGTLLIVGAINLNICVAGAMMRPTKFYDKNYTLCCGSYKLKATTKSNTYVSYQDIGDTYELEDVTENGQGNRQGGSITIADSRPDRSSQHKCMDSALECDDAETETNQQQSHRSSMLVTVKSVLPDWSVCCNAAFLLVEVTAFLHAAAQHAMVSHTVRRGREMGIASFSSSTLPALMGLTLLFGRVLWGLVGGLIRKANPVVLRATSLGVAGISTIVSVHLTTYAVVIHGILDKKQVHSGWMFGFQAEAFGYLTGSPLIGWMRDVQGSYDGGFYVIGTFFIVASICTFLIPVTDKYIVKRREVRS
ncbi:monocarboxylate transporter 13-like isoform X2 [Ptychodera flava]|uniref:monocarboxylate transporter 13-like isoform X2 n=1 Tax=Ptychodera flava TaxID=63121 RepID=UPI00396A62B8